MATSKRASFFGYRPYGDRGIGHGTELEFYRDVLGMKLAGESENYGTEQEHLNNVFGSSVRISGLRAPSGPGIEFLDYLTPRDGRPMPLDTRANDLWHWQTAMGLAAPRRPRTKLKSRAGPLCFPRRGDNPGPSPGHR